jgi:hypothetical protein
MAEAIDCKKVTAAMLFLDQASFELMDAQDYYSKAASILVEQGLEKSLRPSSFEFLELLDSIKSLLAASKCSKVDVAKYCYRRARRDLHFGRSKAKGICGHLTTLIGIA